MLVHFDKYGASLSDAIKYATNSAFPILKNLFNEKNFLFSIFFFLPNCISFFAPWFLLPVIPEIGYILIRNQHSSGQFLVLAFVFLAAIHGTGNFIRFSARVFKRPDLRAYLLRIMSLLIFGFTALRYYYLPAKTDFGEKLGPLPFTAKFDPNFYKFSAHAQTGDRIIKMIPQGSSCLTLQSIGFHLGQCKDIGVFNKYFIASGIPWDYIFLDLFNDDFYQISKKEYFSQLKRFMLEENYGVVHFEDGWLLLKKNYSDKNNPEALSVIDNILTNEK